MSNKAKHKNKYGIIRFIISNYRLLLQNKKQPIVLICIYNRTRLLLQIINNLETNINELDESSFYYHFLFFSN